MSWVATSIDEFTLGGGGFKFKELLDIAKELLASPNAPVRAASCRLIGSVHRFVGPLVKTVLGDLKVTNSFFLHVRRFS